MRYLLITIIFVLFAHNAHASSLIVGGVSYHAAEVYNDNGVIREFNAKNQLLAVEHNGWLAGAMKNSYYENVVFVGYHKQKSVGRYLKLGALVMGSTGYDELRSETIDFEVPQIAGLTPAVYATVQAGPVFLLISPAKVAVATLRFEF